MDPEFVVTALSVHLPPVMRWAGAIARRLRSHNISLTGKTSGSATTDALTLADLTVQELLVAALRDADPIVRCCKIAGLYPGERGARLVGRSPRRADRLRGRRSITAGDRRRSFAADIR